MGLIEKILEINKENIGKIHFWGICINFNYF